MIWMLDIYTVYLKELRNIMTEKPDHQITYVPQISTQIKNLYSMKIT